MGVEAFQGLLWRRGRGGRLGRLVGLARRRGFLRPRPGPAPAAMRPARTALCLHLTLALGLALVGPMAVGWASARAPIYVSSWAVRVSQGYQEVDRLARKFGFVNFGQVGGTQSHGRRREDVRRGRPQISADGRGPLVPHISRTPSSPLLCLTSDSWTPRGHLAGGRCKKGTGPSLRRAPLGEPGLSHAPLHSQIFPDGQYFHLRHRGVVQQSLTPHWGHRLRLKKDPKVSLAFPQRFPPPPIILVIVMSGCVTLGKSPALSESWYGFGSLVYSWEPDGEDLWRATDHV